MIAQATTGPMLRRLAIVATAAILLVVVAWIGARSSTRNQGAQLFHGQTPLTGHLVGHADPLPSEAVQCKNCHSLESDPVPAPSQGGGAPALIETAGPKLGANSLTRPVQRRGGPPSIYTAETFCRVLREGIDPAQVVIPQLMPRFTLTDTECNALWYYLTAP